MFPQTSICKYDLLGGRLCVLIGALLSLWEIGISEIAIRKCTMRGKPEWGICVSSWRAETGPNLWESRKNKNSAENSFTIRAGDARFHGFRISGRIRLRFHPANRGPIWHGHHSIEYRCYCFIAFSVSKAMRKGSTRNSDNNGWTENGAITIFGIVALCQMLCIRVTRFSLSTRFFGRFTVL